jgi:hypothetical protein
MARYCGAPARRQLTAVSSFDFLPSHLSAALKLIPVTATTPNF